MTTLALDHAGFACRKVGQILPIFESLGFGPTQPRELESIDPQTGASRSLGQTSAHIMMTDTYIELSAVPDPRAGNHLEAFLSRYEGLHILALRAAGIEADHRRITEAGFAVTDIQAAQRSIEYGHRHGDARFRWFMLESTITPAGLVCIVDNQTPELVYQPEVLRHANRAEALTGVIICSDAPDEVSARFAQVCATPDTPIRRGDAHEITLANATLSFMTAAELTARFPGFHPPATPSLAGLEIRVPDIGRLAALFDSGESEVLWTGRQQLAVALPAPANGILLFRE